MTCHYQSTPSLSAHCLSWFYMSDMEVGGWSQGHFEPSIDLLFGIKGFCLVLFCWSVKVVINLAVVELVSIFSFMFAGIIKCSDLYLSGQS